MLDHLRRTRKTIGLTLLLGMITWTGCQRVAPLASESRESEGKPTVVEVVRPKQVSLRRVVEQPGAIHAYEETKLFARVPGYLLKVTTDIGQKVRGPVWDDKGKEIEPGQILAEISVPEMEEEWNHKRALVQQAEADAEQARKALTAAEAHIATAEAAVVEAKASQERWGSEAQRIVKMVQSGIIDAQTRDETSNQLKASGARVLSTTAAVQKAKADRDKAKADVQSAEARIEVAKAEARRLERMLAYAKVRAPFDGVVTRRKVDTGDHVHPTAGKDDWLFAVTRLDPVRVVIEVPEADADLVGEKTEVSLQMPALRLSEVRAPVARTSWALTPGSRTLRVEVDLPNREGKFRPGMYVHARLQGEQPVEWALPPSSMVKQGDMLVCFLLEAGKVRRTPLQIGRRDDRFVEVLKLQHPSSTAWQNWTGKEQVVMPAIGLSEGQPVEIKQTGK